MKSIIPFVLILIIATTAGFIGGARSQKHKNFEAEKFSAEWGCLTGGRKGCDAIENETQKYACMAYMVDQFCPEAAEAFERFMSQS